MLIEQFKWNVKYNIVYNVDTDATDILKFLRMNNIHNYNFTVGNVDVADHLRSSNRKWW